MKKAKKLLAVLLVLVLALGMVPFAAAERPVGGFADKDIITDDEAVEVLTAINVLRGRPDGSFDPRAGVTRAEAVVIVARLLLGASVADGLPGNRTGFPDVDGVSGVGFASGAIAWAVSHGVVVGRPNGNFEPNAPVKASEFAIMILRAVGYGRNGEYTGTHWETNGILNGMTLGILTIEDINFQDNANREQIARYAFNALNHEDEAHLLRYVDWSADISNYVPSEMAFRSIFTRIHENAVIPLTYDITGVRDELGRPSIEWMIGDEVIGVYARKIALLFTADTNLTDTTRALRGYSMSSPTSIYMNGVRAGASGMPTAPHPSRNNTGNFTANQIDLAASVSSLTENGYRVEIYTVPYTRTITDIVVVRTFLGEVVNINPATRQIVFENKSGDASLSTTTSFGTQEQFRVNDIDQEDLYAAIMALDLSVRDRVVVTAAWDVGAASFLVVEVVVPQTVVGPIASIVNSPRALTVGGTSYRQSMARHDDVSTATTTQGDATLYLDPYGFVIDVKGGGIIDPVLLMVTDVFSRVDITTGRSSPMVAGVLPNGEVIEVRVTTASASLANTPGIYWVSNVAGGVYTLSTPPTYAQGGIRTTASPFNSDGGTATATRSDLIAINAMSRMSATAMSLFAYASPGVGHYNAGALNNGTEIPQEGVFFATDVKFFYYDIRNEELTYTVREGLHTTPANTTNAGLRNWAVIEWRNGQPMVTAVYLQTLGEDASGLVFVNSLNRTELQPNGDRWSYMNVYRDGVLEVIPFFPRPANDKMFYNIVQLSSGAYASRDPLTTYGAEITALGTHPRLFKGNLASPTALTGVAPDLANADLNIVYHATTGLINITNALVIDLRPAAERSPIGGYPITESGRGIIVALQENKTLELAIFYANNTRQASVIYITDATPK